jgi:hypothetical protein
MPLAGAPGSLGFYLGLRMQLGHLSILRVNMPDICLLPVIIDLKGAARGYNRRSCRPSPLRVNMLGTCFPLGLMDCRGNTLGLQTRTDYHSR